MKSTRTVLCGFVLLFAASAGWAKGKAPRVPAAAQAGSAGQAAASPILGTLQQEMDREMAVFGKADPPAYYMSYTVTDSDRADVTGSNGALLSSQEQRSRWLEGQVRVGSYQLDDTHHVGNQQDGAPGSFGDVVPVDDDAGVLKRAMWRETDGQYRSAAEAFIKVKTGKDVEVQTVAQGAPDFSREKPQVSYGPRASFTWTGSPWEDKVRLVHGFVPAVGGGFEFDRYLHGAGGKSVSGDHRGHQAAVWRQCITGWSFSFRERRRTGWIWSATTTSIGSIRR